MRIRPPAFEVARDVPARADRVPLTDRVRRWWQWWEPAWGTRRGREGLAAGVVAAGIPAAILGVTFVSFVFTAAPDTLFLVGLLTAPFLLVAGVGCLAAVASLSRPATRDRALGYLAGVLVVAVVSAVGFVLTALVAAVAQAWQ